MVKYQQKENTFKNPDDGGSNIYEGLSQECLTTLPLSTTFEDNSIDTPALDRQNAKVKEDEKDELSWKKKIEDTLSTLLSWVSELEENDLNLPFIGSSLMSVSKKIENRLKN